MGATEILVEQQLFVCDHAGLVINAFSPRRAAVALDRAWDMDREGVGAAVGRVPGGSQSVHPTPRTLHTQSSILNPNSEALNHNPSPLNPKP